MQAKALGFGLQDGFQQGGPSQRLPSNSCPSSWHPRNGYHAITTPVGLFEYLRKPFGLPNAGNRFQWMMDHVLDGFDFCLWNLDDVILWPALLRNSIWSVFTSFSSACKCLCRLCRMKQCIFAKCAKYTVPYIHTCQAHCMIQCVFPVYVECSRAYSVMYRGMHRWASPFSPFNPFSPFANPYLPFVSSSTNGQRTNSVCRMSKR
jgi:hypothetical protein